VRLALAGTDWPNIWPPPGAPTLEIDTARLQLVLPALDGPPVADAPRLAAPPRGSARADAHPGERPVVWRIEHDVLTDKSRCVIEHGSDYAGAHDAHVVESYAGEIEVVRHDPADARAVASARFEITWPEATVAAEARMHFVADATCYRIHVELDVDDGGEPLARRSWLESIPRHLQ
jgi:hypothetical protein